ncbi:hypothetical protein B2A_11612, partial [mine drainage metagenome]
MTQGKLVSYVLSKFPPLTPVFGYPFYNNTFYKKTGFAMGEPVGVGDISHAGDFLIPTTDATNLSVLNHFHVPLPHPRWQVPASPSVPQRAGRSTTYVCFVFSDGDNVGTDETVLRGLRWSEKARGTLPVGMSMSPWLARLEPTVYNYYVRTMTRNDTL